MLPISADEAQGMPGFPTNGGNGGEGFNPLSILSAPISGGMPFPSITGGSASSSSSNYQDVFSSSPFNVGSGDLSSEAGKTPAYGNGIADTIESITPIAILVVAAWIAIALIKR